MEKLNAIVTSIDKFHKTGVPENQEYSFDQCSIPGT